MKKILLYIGGTFTLLFAVLHASFWKLGNWQVELSKLTADNSAIVQVLTMGSIYMLVFAALMTFYLARKQKFEFVEKAFLMFVAGYYTMRVIFGYPFFGFSMEELIIWIVCLLVAACYLFAIPQKTVE